eukprot:gene38926-48067_t
MHFAASGGGSAGSGTAGSNNLAGGGSMQIAGIDILKPLGPGGPGGNDVNLNVQGGGGGSGLYLKIRDTFDLHGTIDVSGGTPSNTKSKAGGGAGGSVYIESETGIMSGTGSILSDGGN